MSPFRRRTSASPPALIISPGPFTVKVSGAAGSFRARQIISSQQLQTIYTFRRQTHSPVYLAI
ncbi:MAG: hypothetical protein JL50_06550 [Peptococcaceae bacterium BICA1-7]|nr:MAG: hypothetical protein JL50_06550 [Peptococcaceae bacterium BICA1-7]HBV99272.1 hypothetical protein [Desulfotomaculum sp.]